MKNLYLLVKEQFPEFVVSEYPAFVEFVQHYYKWLADQVPYDVNDAAFLQTAPDLFLDQFKKQYDVYGILSTSDSFNKNYLNFIKDLYTSKGSENGLKEILRIVTGTSVTIDYPSINMLRASDGRWIQESFITITIVSGEMPEVAEKLFISVGESEKEVWVTRFEPLTSTEVRLYYRPSGPLPINEGTIIALSQNQVVLCYGTVIRSAARLNVISGGSDWQLGQVIIIPGSSRNSIARVTKISTTGTIEGVEIVEYGWVHQDGDTSVVYPSSVVQTPGTEAILEFEDDIIVPLIGKWADESGQPSNEEIRLQDSFFYQQFSYVINSQSSPEKYARSVKAGHMAGTKAFYNLSLSTALQTNIIGFTTFPFVELRLGPDIISPEDAFGIFEVTKYFETEVGSTDSFVWNVDKYFDLDVSFTQTENTDVNVGLYADDYFAEDYVVVEINLNIGV